jgi:hypothetical protein
MMTGGQTGENQIEKNERIRVERSAGEQRDVRTNPHDDDSAKHDEKFPTAAELGDAVRKTLAKRQFLFELLLEVVGKNLVLLQALDDFLIKRGKFANLFLQDLFYVIFAEFAQVIQTDKAFAIQARDAFLDEFEQRWPDQFRYHSALG